MSITKRRIEPTRSRFRATPCRQPELLRYRDRASANFPVVVEQSFNTAYEELTCVSYSPRPGPAGGDVHRQAPVRLRGRSVHEGQLGVRALLHRLRLGLAGRRSGRRQRARHPGRAGLPWREDASARVRVRRRSQAARATGAAPGPAAACGRSCRGSCCRRRASPTGRPSWGNRLEAQRADQPAPRAALGLPEAGPVEGHQGARACPPLELIERAQAPGPGPGPLADVPLRLPRRDLPAGREVPVHRFAFPHVAKHDGRADGRGGARERDDRGAGRRGGVPGGARRDRERIGEHELRGARMPRPREPVQRRRRSSRPSTSSCRSGTPDRRARRGASSTSRSGPTGTTTASSSTSAPSRPTCTTTRRCPRTASATRRSCRSTSARSARTARRPCCGGCARCSRGARRPRRRTRRDALLGQPPGHPRADRPGQRV